MIHRRTMLRGDCPAARGGLSSLSPSHLYSPTSLSLSEGGVWRSVSSFRSVWAPSEFQILTPITREHPTKISRECRLDERFLFASMEGNGLSGSSTEITSLNELILSRLWPLRFTEEGRGGFAVEVFPRFMSLAWGGLGDVVARFFAASGCS